MINKIQIDSYQSGNLHLNENAVSHSNVESQFNQMAMGMLKGPNREVFLMEMSMQSRGPARSGPFTRTIAV